MQRIDMYDVQIRYQNLKPNGHWFDRDTMRCFRTRLANEAYLADDESRVWFVTSEQFVNPVNGYVAPRAYSVRVMDWRTGKIDTVGEFNALSRTAAHTKAQKLAKTA